MLYPIMVEQISATPVSAITQVSFKCSLPIKVLRCGSGYEFKQLDTSSVMLMRGTEPGPVLSCGCNSAQRCELQVDPGDPHAVIALENTCGGNWGWGVRLPGIAEAFLLLPVTR